MGRSALPDDDELLLLDVDPELEFFLSLLCRLDLEDERAPDDLVVAPSPDVFEFAGGIFMLGIAPDGGRGKWGGGSGGRFALDGVWLTKPFVF